MTLSDFINKNNKLLTALGVFVSLSLFTDRIDSSALLSKYLSFLFLLLAIIIWLELWRKYPKRGDPLLSWFETILSFAFLMFIMYWFFEYREITFKYIPLIIGLIVFIPVSHIIKKYNLFNRVFKARQGEKPLLRYLIATALILGIVLAIIRFQNLFESYFDRVYKDLFSSKFQ